MEQFLLFNNIFFMMKKLLIATVLSLALANSASAAASNKVLLCHSTNSAQNPTVMINVSENSVEAQLAEGSTLPRQLPDGSYTCTVEVVPE